MPKPLTVFNKQIGILRDDKIFIKRVNITEHFLFKRMSFGFSVYELLELNRMGCKAIRIIAYNKPLPTANHTYIEIANSCDKLPSVGEEKIFDVSVKRWIEKGFREQFEGYDRQIFLGLNEFNRAEVSLNYYE